MGTAAKPDSLTWAGVAKRAIRRAAGDDISMRSAQLAYYFFLSVFPLAICLVAVIGVFAAESAHFRSELLRVAAQLVPSSNLLKRTINDVASNSGNTVISVGAVVTLWSASSGMSAVMDALNAQYRVRESRPFLTRILLAITLTIAVGILLLLAITIVLVGAAQVSAVGGGMFIRTLWEVARWPVVLVLALFGFALIYHFAPRVHRDWHWISPGSVTALAVWIVASVGFRIYVHYFAHYSKTYGSLAAVIVLLLWFYITGLAILIGSEVNIVIESAALGHADSEAERPESAARPSIA